MCYKIQQCGHNDSYQVKVFNHCQTHCKNATEAIAHTRHSLTSGENKNNNRWVIYPTLIYLIINFCVTWCLRYQKLSVF